MKRNARQSAPPLKAFSALFLGLIVGFAVFENGAHDLWAATLVYGAVLTLFLIWIAAATWSRGPAGLKIVGAAPLSILLGIFTLSVIYSVNPEESVFELLDWCAAGLLLLLALQIFDSEQALNRFLSVVGVVLLIEFVLIFMQKLIHPDFFPISEVPGTLINSNIGAAFHLFWVPIVIEKIKTNPKSPFWWSVGVALLLSLLFFASRWAVICGLIGVPFCFERRFWQATFKKKKKLLFGAGAVFLLCLAALVIEKFARSTTDFISIVPRTPLARLDWWRGAFQMGMDNLWLGVGLGNFPSAYGAYKTVGGIHSLYPHSFIFGLFGETGILGFSAAVGFFIWWVRSLKSRKPYVIGVALFLMFSSVNLGYEYLINLMTLGLFMGIALAPNAGKRQKIRSSVGILLLALGVGGIPYLVSPFFSSQSLVYANSLMKEGDWDKAFVALDDARKLYPLSSEAYRGMAQISYRRGDVEGAISYQKKAIELNTLNEVLKREYAVYAGGR